MEILILLLLFPVAYLLIKFWLWLVNSIMNPMIDRAEKREQNKQENLYSFATKKEREKEEIILNELGIKRPNPITDEYIIFMRNRGVNIG